MFLGTEALTVWFSVLAICVCSILLNSTSDVDQSAESHGAEVTVRGGEVHKRGVGYPHTVRQIKSVQIRRPSKFAWYH
jgi:hypothetical protein